MRYMLLVYSNEKSMAARPLDEQARIAAGHWAVMEVTARRGILNGADPLEPTRKARTVRNEKGRTVITDGPFAETQEQLAGYYILDCKDFDEALEWAAKIPTARAGGAGCVEVRPILELQPKAGQTGP